jgi:tetratricopeptide (TPR) repeat protein
VMEGVVIRASRVSLLFALWCAVAGVGIAAGQSQTTVEKYLAAGRRASQRGNLVEAQKQFEAAVDEAKHSRDPRLSLALNNLASVYFREEQTERAIAITKEALSVDEAAYGKQTFRVALDLNNLGTFYEAEDDPRAEKCFKGALEIVKGTSLPRRAFGLMIISNLSQFYMRSKRYAESEALLKRAIDELENSSQPQGSELARLEHLLALTYKDEGRQAKSEEVAGQAEEALQPEHNPHFDSVFLNLRRAESYQNSGQLGVAEATYRQAISVLQATRTDHGKAYPPSLPEALDGLGRIYAEEKKDVEAEQLFRRALEVNEQYVSSSEQGKRMARYSMPLIDLLNLMRDNGRLNEMEPLFQSWLAVQEKVLGREDSAVGWTLLDFARLYREEGKDVEALPLYQQAIAIQEKNWGETPQLAALLDGYAGLLQSLGEERKASAARARVQRIQSRFAADGKKH